MERERKHAARVAARVEARAAMKAKMKAARAKAKKGKSSGAAADAAPTMVAVRVKKERPQCDAMPLNADLFAVGRRVGLAYDARLLAHRMPTPASEVPPTPSSEETSDENVVANSDTGGGEEETTSAAAKKPKHPECPERLLAIMRQLEEEGLAERCVPLPARLATMEELALCHDAEYLRRMQTLRDDVEDGHTSPPSGEELAAASASFNSVYLCAESVRCAALATGAAVHAVHEVAAGRLDSAVAVVRPPGHHAEPACAMGFCIFGTVAVAARAAAQRGERVLVVDWDVHHGNGTQSATLTSAEILTFSVHRHHNGNFYPKGPEGGADRVGVGAGEGRNVNVAWNCFGMGDAQYAAAWDEVLLPIAREFAPTLVIVAAGFDAARGDPLGRCDVTPRGFATLLAQLQALPSVAGRVVLVLEGGYSLRSIAHCFSACVANLLGHPPAGEEPIKAVTPEVEAAAAEAIAATIAAHRSFWACFPDLPAEEVEEAAAEEESPPAAPAEVETAVAAVAAAEGS